MDLNTQCRTHLTCCYMYYTYNHSYMYVNIFVFKVHDFVQVILS